MDEMTVLEPGGPTADRHAAVQAILGVWGPAGDAGAF